MGIWLFSPNPYRTQHTLYRQLLAFFSQPALIYHCCPKDPAQCVGSVRLDGWVRTYILWYTHHRSLWYRLTWILTWFNWEMLNLHDLAYPMQLEVSLGLCLIVCKNWTIYPGLLMSEKHIFQRLAFPGPSQLYQNSFLHTTWQPSQRQQEPWNLRKS